MVSVWVVDIHVAWMLNYALPSVALDSANPWRNDAFLPLSWRLWGGYLAFMSLRMIAPGRYLSEILSRQRRAWKRID